MRERKAAVIVSIIIAAFLLCFLPLWITVGIFLQFVKNVDVPAEVILGATCTMFVSSVCNPIIYAIRKNDFIAGVKKVFRRVGLCGSSNDIDNNVIGNHGTEAFSSTPAAALATGHQHEGSNGSTVRYRPWGDRLDLQRHRLSPVPQMVEELE